MASKEDSLWFKDAVIYELSVRSFYDSNGDGIGDFQGLIQRLDYLEDLGITTLWLLPFYPSPLRDDGFDITDHCDVHPDYGNLADFKQFLKEAHRRGIKVIIELILNHTSDEHPWFREALRRKDSKERDFYLFRRGKGKIFYFRPGHEIFPVYKQTEPMRVIENAVRWLGTREP